MTTVTDPAERTRIANEILRNTDSSEKIRSFYACRDGETLTVAPNGQFQCENARILPATLSISTAILLLVWAIKRVRRARRNRVLRPSFLKANCRHTGSKFLNTLDLPVCSDCFAVLIAISPPTKKGEP